MKLLLMVDEVWHARWRVYSRACQASELLGISERLHLSHLQRVPDCQITTVVDAVF
jgi:hypothetical protein